MNLITNYYVRILLIIIFAMEAKGDWYFRISDLIKTPDGTDI